MKSFRDFRSILFAAGLVMLAASPVGALAHQVPDPFPTIQAGIDASGAGDTVLVAAGTYAGPGNRDLDFGGIDLVLISEDGAEVTTIDAEGSSTNPHRGFLFTSGESNAATVEGFTVRGGYTFNSDGGGFYCDGSSPTIRGSIITENIVPSPSFDGGGIYLRDSDARIEGCTVSRNFAMYGGGIACRGNTTATIADCDVVENVAGYGGGIDAGGIGSPYILRCRVMGNDATSGFEDPGSGGGLVLGGDAVVEDCVITGNVSRYGAGVAAWSGMPAVLGSTISGNDAGEWRGGGVSATNSSLLIERSILWGNCAATGGEYYTGGSGAILAICCVYGSDGFEEEPGSFVAGPHSLTLDPLFCDPQPCGEAPNLDGDYRIDRSSVCFVTSSPCQEWIGALGVGCPVAEAPGEADRAVSIRLGPVHPNPTMREIAFTVTLPEPGAISISLIDLTGRRVAAIDRGVLPAGEHSYRYDTARSSQKLASGWYSIRLETGGRVESRRFLLTR